MALAAPDSGTARAAGGAKAAGEAVAAADAASRQSVGEGRYGGHSDQELTALAADWDALDRHQRRALLTEMKLRMARKGEREDLIRIRTERRYGRIIRQSDGRVIRIETQVVHVRPVTADDLDAEDVEGRRSFGVGFEHRIGRREEQAGNDTGAQASQSAAATRPQVLLQDHAPQGGAAAALDDMLSVPAPSTQAPPVVNRLPVYQVSDPER